MVAVNDDQVETFCNTCKVPLNIAVSVHRREQLMSLNTNTVVLLLPGWFLNGFRIVDIMRRWKSIGGKVFNVTEEHLSGKIPLDKTPIM